MQFDGIGNFRDLIFIHHGKLNGSVLNQSPRGKVLIRKHPLNVI